MWARSEVGLSRLPVTEKIAGSNPVGPAKILFTNTTKCGIILFNSRIKSLDLRQYPQTHIDTLGEVMDQATKEIKITETGDRTFLFTCPVPGGINKLMHRPFSSDQQWDRFTDRGEEGFEVQINVDHRNGKYGGPPRILEVIQDIWAELHKAELVQTGEVPDITFGESGSLTTHTASSYRRR